MLGGGVFTTVGDKTLPGTYINFVSAAQATGSISSRGVVAICYDLGSTTVSYGDIVEITREEFWSDAETKLGVAATDATMKPFREIFKHATKCVIYNLSGTDGVLATALSALEPYEFNVLAAYTSDAEDITAYMAKVKTWRTDVGKKCQLVKYATTQSDNDEGIINVINTVSDAGADAYALVAWLAGAEAGCAVNESCTNKIYDGEYTVVTTDTKSNLEAAITAGNIAFHLVYGNVRVLEDINTLTTTTTEKGDDFKSNQTIRVLDQIANDIARVFNTKFLGIIPNNAAGRTSFWAEIVKHHRGLETLQAIENFDSANVVVSPVPGNKKQIQVTDIITVVNAMSQVYMTVVVE